MFAGLLVLGVGKLMYQSWIDAQTEKNNLLKREIVKLDAQIADIQDLETRKQRLGRAHGDHRESCSAAGRKSCTCSMKW